MTKVNKTLRGWLESGAHLAEDMTTKIRVQNLNTIYLFGCVCLNFFIAFDLSQGLYYSCLPLIFLELMFFVGIYLNRKGKFTSSGTIIYLSFLATVFTAGYIIKAPIRTDYILISSIGMPALLINSKKKNLIFFLIGTNLLVSTIFVFLNIDGNFGFYELDPQTVKSMYTLNFIQGALLFIFQVYYIMNLMEKRYHHYFENQKDLENQTRMSDLGRMMAGIAHEINNPLSIISSACSYSIKRIDKGTLDQERQLKELRRINSQVSRVVKIIQGLKLISRDGSKDQYEAKDISTVINSAYDICQFNMNNQKITYSFTPLNEVILCHMREVQIEQVILSLLSNATDAMEGQKEKVISIKMRKDAFNVFIMVTDNGPGIPSEIKQDLFKPFFTTKPIGKGTGLGLSIAFDIIKNHNGRISVESNTQGTTFIIRLPIYHEKGLTENQANQKDSKENESSVNNSSLH